MRALVPRYDRCGAKGQRHLNGNVKLGRPCTISRETGVITTTEVESYFEYGIKLFKESGRRGKQWSLVRAYREIIETHYMVGEIRDSAGRVIDVTLAEHYPSVGQFRYYYRTRYSEPERHLNRVGPRIFAKDARGLLGRARDEVVGPGERFQIDATIADIYLCSVLDRRRLVGRPTVYIIIDVYSHMIVSVYVCFEPPSWGAASFALINMVTPKADLCARYGIQIRESEWPSHHAPGKLLGDRGELLSDAAGQNIQEMLGIDIENAPPYRADAKGLVERTFGTLPAIWGPFTPGYVAKDAKTRGARDYRRDGTLNINEFTKIMLESALQHNRNMISGYHPPPAMTTQGLIASPLNIWNWGIVNRSGTLRQLSVEEVALNVSRVGEGRITEHGLTFNGDRFRFLTAEGQQWFSQARRKSWPIEVRYDSGDFSKILVCDPSLPRGFERAINCEHCEVDGPISLAEILEIQAAEKDNRAAATGSVLAGRIATDLNVKKIVSSAESERGNKPLPLSSVRGMKEARKIEVDHLRRIEGGPLAKVDRNSSEEAVCQRDVLNDDSVALELLREIKREKEP